jgi:tripartite motif-containing protein 71
MIHRSLLRHNWAQGMNPLPVRAFLAQVGRRGIKPLELAIALALLAAVTTGFQQPTQYVYVMDSGNARVQKFDLNGKYITEFGLPPGINLGWGLAVDASGNTWVAAQGSDALMEFDASGNFVRWLGSTGSANGQFIAPDAVAFATNGDMWVADQGNSRVQRFNTGGTWQQSVGGSGQTSGVWSVVTDTGGNLYVVDYDNSRVHKFASSGTYLTAIGSEQLINPYDAAIDAGGNIWIVDQDRVQKFDSNGNYITQFGTSGSANGQFNAPFGIAIDASDNIWVADNNNNRVQKFDKNGNFLLAIGAGYNGVQGNVGEGGNAAGQFSTPPRVAIAGR